MKLFRRHTHVEPVSRARVCDDCGCPAGYHELWCDRVQFVIDCATDRFRRQLDQWDGSLEEIARG